MPYNNYSKSILAQILSKMRVPSLIMIYVTFSKREQALLTKKILRKATNN
jgi:hypothetical protein